MADTLDRNLKIQRRIRRLRIIGYSVTGLFTLWLIIAAVVSISAGLRNGTVIDPFTDEPVAPMSNEP